MIWHLSSWLFYYACDFLAFNQIKIKFFLIKNWNSMKFLIFLVSSVALLGCVRTPSKAVSYGNDALPSEEVIAFQAADTELKYQNARIEFDAKNCALYQGIASDGKLRSALLINPQGQPICIRPAQ